MFAVKAFDGDFVFDDSDNDIAVFGIFLLAYKEEIAFKDGVVDHGAATDFKSKDFFLGGIAKESGVDEKGFFGFFDAGDRGSGGDGAEERDTERGGRREVDFFAV